MPYSLWRKTDVNDRKTTASVLKFVIVFALIPALILSGVFIFKEKHHAYIITAVSILTVLVFFLSFEQKKITTRRLVLCAVMTCLSVVGRFIPFLKPTAAITVISAVYMGPESGFLVGALSALISNFYFGHGPWTPHQMFAWGIIGFIAGLLAKPLEKSRVALTVYGAISGVIYSMMLDVWTVLWYNGEFSLSLYTAALITSAPHTLLYTASNVLFLLLLYPSFGTRLKRIKLKYGI